MRCGGGRRTGGAPPFATVLGRYPAPMPTNLPEGFTFRERKSGEVEVQHFGRLAALLRGRQAERFRERAAGATDGELQQLMARVTGNYRRGNERR